MKDLLKKELLNKDLLNKVDDIVDNIKSNKDLLNQFQKDPVAALESIIGIDLPNDQVEKIIDAVKAKLTVDDISSAIGTLGKLFGKK